MENNFEDIKYILRDDIIEICGNFKLTNINQAMDIILSATFEHNCSKIILNQKNIDKSFFDLKTKFAGELLQKLINYNCSVVLVGEFESFGSKALNDFIFECNRKENIGSRIFFLNTIDDAILRLREI